VENNLDAKPAAGQEVDNEEPVQMPDKEVEEGRGRYQICPGLVEQQVGNHNLEAAQHY